MAPRWKVGWTKTAFILLLATLPLAAAAVDPKVSALDPPEDLASHRYWEARPPSENAPSKRLMAASTLIEGKSKVLVAGGMDDFQEFDTLHLYDIASGSWEKLNLTMNIPRSVFKMATFNTEIIQDLVVIIGGQSYDPSVAVQVIDMKARSFLHPIFVGEAPMVLGGGHTMWKDLFILYGGFLFEELTYSNEIYLLNVTNWTWSKAPLKENALPFLEYANMVVVPKWNGRDTVFIYSNIEVPSEHKPGPCPGQQSKCVFAVDLETWNVTMFETETPGPKGEHGSVSSLVSADPHGNRYSYHYGGKQAISNTNNDFLSDLSVLKFEPVLDWVTVPVHTNPQIQGSWHGILIAGLPQNMPAWIGEEPLVYMQGAQDGSPYVTIETHLTLGGISPFDSIINGPTVNGSLVPEIFQVYAGDSIQFTVVPRNALGVPLPYGGDDVIGFLRRLDGVEKSCATVEDVNSDIVQYIIKCPVTLQGNYTFKIQMRHKTPIVPKYQFSVQPASVSFSNSIAEGYGMQQASAGEVAIYKTKLYDVYGNRASVVAEDVHVSPIVGCSGKVSLAEATFLDASSFEQVDVVVTLDDPVSSLYIIEYIPKTRGVCRIQNMVNDVPFGNVTYVVVGDPPVFIPFDSGEGATLMVVNILSCLAACAASYHFGIKAKGGYRDGLIFISGALALIGNVLYIGEPLDATCKARSAVAMIASGMLMGVIFSQTWWYLGYYRTPILAKQLPISPKRTLKYASAAICCEVLLIIILQTTAPIHRSLFTVKGKTYAGCADASGANILHFHLVLLFLLSVISALTKAHKAPDIATSINSAIAYNLSILALFLIGLIGYLQNEDMRIFVVLQSLDIWIACIMTFGLVIYSKVQERNDKKIPNLMVGGKNQMQTLAVESKITTERSSSSGGSQKMVLAEVHLRQDDFMKTTWKKCLYFHPSQLAYGIIYSDFGKPAISLENIGDAIIFENDKSGLRYGLRLKIGGEEKVLAFTKAANREEYLEALKKIRVTKGSGNV